MAFNHHSYLTRCLKLGPEYMPAYLDSDCPEEIPPPMASNRQKQGGGLCYFRPQRHATKPPERLDRPEERLHGHRVPFMRKRVFMGERIQFVHPFQPVLDGGARNAHSFWPPSVGYSFWNKSPRTGSGSKQPPRAPVDDFRLPSVLVPWLNAPWLGAFLAPGFRVSRCMEVT